MHGPVRRSEAVGSNHLIPRFFKALALACLVSLIMAIPASAQQSQERRNAEGKATIFAYYRIRIASVIRDYSSESGSHADV